MFKLLRYFSVASLIAFLIVLLVLGIFYRQTTVDVLVELEGEKNIALARAFANSIFPELQAIISTSAEMEVNELRSSPGIEALHQLFVEQSRGLPVVKIKIYGPDGLTVFSTEPRQIGEAQFENAGFQSAMNGLPISNLVHRDTFNAFDMVLEDRDLIQSYIPIFSHETGQVSAVFELYSDVTLLLKKIQRTQLSVISFVVIILAGLYGVLFLIVHQADHIIHSQYQALEQAKAEVTEARDQALKANQFKTHLLENVSHDLRTPLSVIVGYVDLLSDNQYGPITEQQQRALNRIQLSVGHLTDLVNDLLKQGQIDADELTISLAPFELADLVKNVQTHMKFTAENKGLQTTITVDPDLPAILYGDWLHLTQVINNLTSNAIKFTDQGQVKVEFSRKSPQQWCILVHDTGAGVPPEKLQSIFEPFQKVEDVSRRDREGIGLGLAIVKHLTTLMDGQISIKSLVGQGSTFVLTFPLILEAEGDESFESIDY